MELKDIYKEIETIIEILTTKGITRKEASSIIKLRNKLRNRMVYYQETLNEDEYKTFCLMLSKIENISKVIENSNLLYTYSKTQLDILKKNASILPLVLADRYSDKMHMQGLNGYMLVCPLHNEQTPSLRIRDHINGFCCFGCGNSGNVFRYIEQISHGNINFKSAVDLLSKIYMYKETKKDDKYYDLINKYWQSIISPEYKELLLIGKERLKKCNVDFMPQSTTLVDDYYKDRFKMIERIENSCLDTSLDLQKPKESILIISHDQILGTLQHNREELQNEYVVEKPAQKVLTLETNTNLNSNEEDDDGELPF